MVKENYSQKSFIAYQTNKINDLISKNKISLAKKIIFELLENFSDDKVLLKLLVRICFFEKNFEYAENILLNMKKSYYQDEFIYNRLAYIYIKNNEVEKLYELYENYYKNKKLDDICLDDMSRKIKLYLEKKFNPIFEVKRDKLPYHERQIYEYDEAEAIIHIKEKHCSEKYIKKSIFKKEINIEDLFYKIKESIKENEDNSYTLEISDVYYFYYPCCGECINIKDDSKHLANYIKVCSIVGTNKILSMYPYNIMSNTRVSNLQNDMDEKKIKVKSGLERFNSRYK